MVVDGFEVAALVPVPSLPGSGLLQQQALVRTWWARQRTVDQRVAQAPPLRFVLVLRRRLAEDLLNEK